MTHSGPEPSLHYVDAARQPLDVRRWYRFWVGAFASIAVWLAYAAAATPRIGGFDAGTRVGGAATSGLLALSFGYAWLNDILHRRESRRYWIRHNRSAAVRMILGGAVGTAGCLVGIVAAMRAADTFVSGLLIAPGTAALFALVLATDARRRQQQRQE
ncbi:MAG TPA: hypothetical protein VFH66_00890 [Mycobacteriales bacterium]|nr:hypothetical protein [Mycobacteriales bacterium]